MNEIKIFKNVESGAIRTMSNDQGEPMFCAKDVCDALGYNNSRDTHHPPRCRGKVRKQLRGGRPRRTGEHPLHERRPGGGIVALLPENTTDKPTKTS